MIKNIIKTLFASVFLLTPIIISANTSEMFEIPKMIFVYTVGFTLIFFLFIFVILRKSDLKIGRMHYLVFFFLCTQVVSYFFSIDRHTSWYGYYGRFNGGVLSTITYFIYFFVGSYIFDEKWFAWMLRMSVVASLVVLLWGIPGRFFGVDTACIYFRGDFSNSCWTNEFRPAERMFSTLGQPNWLGTYFAAHVFIGLYLFFRTSFKNVVKFGTSRWSKMKILYLLYSLIMVAGVYLTGSRSALLSILIPVLIEALFMLSKKLSKKLIIVVLSITILVGIFGTWSYTRSMFASQTSGITHSGKIRLIVWEGALKLFAKYPAFGTGPETFAFAYYQTRPVAHNYTTEKDFIYNKAHNEFLNMLSNTGIAGFVTYFGLVSYSIYLLLRKKDRLAEDRLIAYAILSISVCNFFGFSTSTSQLLLYLFFVYSAAKDWHSHWQISGVGGFKSKKYRIPAIALVTIVWLSSMVFVSSYLRADVLYSSSQSMYQSGSPLKAIALCMSAYETKFEHIYADRCASMSASTALLLRDGESEELQAYKESFVDLANSYGYIALKYSPQNPIYLRSRAKVLGLLLQIDPKNNQYKSELKDIRQKYKRLAPTDEFSM